MKKRLNTDLIGSELREGSAFFRDYKKSESPPPPAAEIPPTLAPQSLIHEPEQTIPERVNVRTPVRSNTKRIITRNSFEIYEDQMDSLRELAYREKREGRIGSMSAMVREAIDTFLKKNSVEK